MAFAQAADSTAEKTDEVQLFLSIMNAAVIPAILIAIAMLVVRYKKSSS